MGVGTIIWRKSALDCPERINKIFNLFHSQFESGPSGRRNNGGIIGRSNNTTSDSDGIKYISQLIILLDIYYFEV